MTTTNSTRTTRARPASVAHAECLAKESLPSPGRVENRLRCACVVCVGQHLREEEPRLADERAWDKSESGYDRDQIAADLKEFRHRDAVDGLACA